jgi:hypothetical protein
MEKNTSTYKLEQNGKVYMFSTSLVGDNIRLSCKNSSSPKNKRYSRDFTIENLRKLDKLFNVLKTPIQAIQYIDEALRQQKVGVTEENNGIKITFYITTKGITNQIDIPLGDMNSMMNTSNGNEYLYQNEKIENYEINNAPQEINYEQYFQNAEYNQDIQNTPIENVDYNQYTTTNIESNTNLYTPEQNYQENTNTEFDVNKYFSDTNTNTAEGPYISPADNNEVQEYQQEQNINTNVEVEQYNNINNINEYSNNQMINQTETKEVENTDINFDEQIKQILQQENSNVNINVNEINSNNIITTQAEEKEINQESKPLTTTKVLPVKTTTRILPPIGPFTSLNGLDLHKLGMMNSEHQKMPPFEQVFENTTPEPQTETKTEYYEINEQISTQPKYVTKAETKTTKTTMTTNINTNMNQNINVDSYLMKNIPSADITQRPLASNQTQIINNIKTENISLKKQIAELRKSQKEIQNVTITKSQLAELDSLRKKVAEFEILKGQLKELNTLRMQLAELNSAKAQLKELNILKEKINAQNKELAQLRLKAAEAEKLKLQVQELEKIKLRYEKDIVGLKESLRIYSIKTNAKEEKEEKEVIEDDTPEEITVKGDIIHDTNELELITKKINVKNQKLTLNLLYKASADSDKAAAFHAKCDQAKSTIVLIETDKGKRFGGFTSCSWEGDCLEKQDESAFVFSLDKMKTYDNIPGEEAIGCYPKFGPIFLGCQIRIYNDAFTKGGSTFERGLNFDTEEDYELTGGDRIFKVKEIEVYEVVFE